MEKTQEMENLSDVDDLVGDTEYQPPRQEPSSSEEDSSGCEDPIPQPSKPIRGRKLLREEYDGYRSDSDIARSCTPRHSQTQQGEDDVSNNLVEETTPGPSHQEQSKKGRGMWWRAFPLTPNQAQFEHEEETVDDKDWTPFDYIEQYIDKDLMKMIADCSNAMSLARSGDQLNTSADEIYHFFLVPVF